MNTSIFFSIFNLLFLGSTRLFCERIPDPKTDMKVEIEVAYVYNQLNDLSHATPIHKTMRVSYSIPNSPKILSSDIRGNNRQSNNNNLRQEFRFSTNEKGAGAFTMSTYEEGPDSGIRTRGNFAVFGKLIHVVSVSDNDLGGNTTSLSWSHNACNNAVNSVHGNWVALVQSGVCSHERKLKQIMRLPHKPQSILIYGSHQVVIKQESFVAFNQEDTPIVIFLPWSNIQSVVQKCFNSSGHLSLPPELHTRMNRSLPDWSFNSRHQCNVSVRVFTTPDDNFLNKTSVLFVSISFILLMVISLAWLMFYYVQRFRYIHTKEQFSRRLAHMAKKAVAKIPVKTINQGDKETDAEVDNCAICIECYKPPDMVRILPCKHFFHKGCIDPWLLEQRSCPMCKLNILHAYGFLPNERGSMISEDRLSDMDSSIELQFLSGSTIVPYPGPSTRIQTHGQARHSSDSGPTSAIDALPTSALDALPPIFSAPAPAPRGHWTSLSLKRVPRSSRHIDRSASLRHLAANSEEGVTFLHHERPLSLSATNTVLGPSVTPGRGTSSLLKAPDRPSQLSQH